MRNKNSFVKNLISVIILILLLIFAYVMYQKYNFNEYVKAEYKSGVSKFERDGTQKVGKSNSYKIENTDYNDAMFFKTIDVTPNTPYKVTCKIKTEGVKTSKENTDAGAHISLKDELDKSDNVVGTTDWTEVTFYFNSKNREQVDLGFRLGGNEDSCIGTAWFTDFTLESGIRDESNTWNFLCLMFDNIDVSVEKDGTSQNIKLGLTQVDKDDVSVCMRRFKSSMQEMSNNKIRVNYDIQEISSPITEMSYDEENGYFVSGYDIKEILDSYIKQGKYDHIFVAFRTGDINKKNASNAKDWIGLGAMDYRGLGFSNIRLPDDDSSYLYKYDTRVNTFPEEVFIHEFLHTLERNTEEYGIERPELHDNEKFGYENKRLIGLKEWYQDYMNKNINTSSGKIGLPAEIFTKKPVKAMDFEYTHKLDYLKEPENIMEELSNLFTKIINLFKRDEQLTPAENEA